MSWVEHPDNKVLICKYYQNKEEGKNQIIIVFSFLTGQNTYARDGVVYNFLWWLINKYVVVIKAVIG